MTEEGGPGTCIPRGGSRNIAAAQVLLKKGKRYAARYLRDECLHHMHLQENPETASPKVLPDVLDLLLNPALSLNSWETIDWLKWLMAAGLTPDEFFSTVRGYDNATTCGLVWTANFVAYRCRTCGISPCMSLCSECFQEGNHEGHDFNMFRSHAGGACDCGNHAVMKETGFCHRHGTQAQRGKPEVPPDLLAIAEAVMPRLFHRFIIHCREFSDHPQLEVRESMSEANALLDFLQELSRLGAAMRATMTKTLCNPTLYKNLTSLPSSTSPGYEEMKRSTVLYHKALNSISLDSIPRDYEDVPTLAGELEHHTFLDETVFWTVKYEFPLKLVCLLLNMRPDPDYEDAFARAFVQHYSRISVMLVRSSDSDTLSNRVVHVSVQLFSDQNLAYRMTDTFHLLHVMVISLKNMMKSICVPSLLKGGKGENRHSVVNCAHEVMKNHCYWPLVSDLNNILSHRPIAIRFMSDPRLVSEWFSFLSLFQGMNVNTRELLQHVEYEPQTYYAAFSAELEASSSPVWALVSHLKDSETSQYTLAVVKQCLQAISIWFEETGFSTDIVPGESEQVSFHLPLHRYFSVLMCQAIKYQQAKLQDLLPTIDLLAKMIIHPLKVQAGFYEIISGLWVRNGLQIRGQAMTYIQCHFCNSMVDADLYLLQIGAGELPPNDFITTILERFSVKSVLSLNKQTELMGGVGLADSEHQYTTLESCLIFLATIMTVRTNLGLPDNELSELEMVTILCMGDKTHSQLMDLMPEKCSSGAHNRDFEAVLSQISEYRAPNFEASGAMQQGMYSPKDHIWSDLYDPIYVLLRAVQRRDYQSSLDRFKQYCKLSDKMSSRMGNLWPPFRLPKPVSSAYTDPRRVLASRTVHGIFLVILYKAFHDSSITESLLSLAVYLIEITVDYQASVKNEGCEMMASQSLTVDEDFETKDKTDGKFYDWFPTDDIFFNSTYVVSEVRLNGSPCHSIASDEIERSDIEMEEIEGPEACLALVGQERNNRALPSGSELVPYEEGAVAIVPVGAAQPNIDPLSPLALPPSSAASGAADARMVPASEGSSMIVPSTATPVHALTLISGSLPSLYQYLPLLSGSEVARVRQPSASSGIRNAMDLYPNVSFRPRARRPAGGAARALPPPQVLEMGSTFPFAEIPSLRTGDEYVTLNQSIISLLILLHSKLSGKPRSYKPNFEFRVNNRIGDGPFFIANLLNKLGMHNTLAKMCILDTLKMLYPRADDEGSASSEEEIAAKAREERKKNARERQRKVMAEFAQKQRRFMERNTNWAESCSSASHDMDGEADVVAGTSRMDVDEEEAGDRHKQYECVICNQSIPSTPERPVGMVVLLQATSVLGHATRSWNPLKLPTTDTERIRLRQERRTLGNYIEARADIFGRNFDLNSWLLSMNIGYVGGVHVQTCGHHLHLDCHQSYVLSLRSHHRPIPTNLNVDKGEYWCPLCRQLANAVLPISPEIGNLSAVVKLSASDEVSLIEEIDGLLCDMSVPKFSDALTQSMARIMESMTVATYGKYRTISSNPSTPSLFTFVSSILRTNLGVELIQRGGSLVNQTLNSKMNVRRSCLMPLLHVLGFHSKILNGAGDTLAGPGGATWIRQTWSAITQTPIQGLESAVTSQEREVPLLLKDQVTQLLQMVLLLPSRIDQAYFRYIVSNLYRVVVIQAAIAALRSLSKSQREQATSSGPLAPLLSLAHSNLRDSSLFCNDEPVEAFGCSPEETRSNIYDVTSEVRESCLEFLRVASLLRYHIYEEKLPGIGDPLAECGALEQYLGVWEVCSVVNISAMGRMCDSLKSSGEQGSSLHTLGTIYELTSPVETHIGDLNLKAKVWCSQVFRFAQESQVAASSLLSTVRFFQPRLLRLPYSYDAVFQYYHRRQCSQCNSVPKDPSVCLLCGTVICLREPCCKQQDLCEGVQHAIDCGAGTAMFLVINQSTVLVIRGQRVCLWGCVHLDSYGEEDRDLKRGKPLFLSEDRYNLLESQWLSHTFDHTKRKWFWHRDAF